MNKFIYQSKVKCTGEPGVDFSNVKMVDDDGLEYYIVRMFQEPMPDFESFIS